MNVLLLSGYGPSLINENILDNTLFSKAENNENANKKLLTLKKLIDINGLVYKDKNRSYRLLRARKPIPQLTTHTLTSILEDSGINYEFFDLKYVWNKTREPVQNNFNAILLSTTFITSLIILYKAVRWIINRFPDLPIILGGQYSNLKYREILKSIPDVDYIILGDGESALPRLLKAIENKEGLEHLSNLVSRDVHGTIIKNDHYEYINFDDYPAPRFSGVQPVIPYESMRGCPFGCKFCSTPSASPKWRYKSAGKIINDWIDYRKKNGAQLIKAMDSTFNVPKERFNALLKLLPGIQLNWGSLIRADLIDNEKIIDTLEKANCTEVSIGFESMCNTTLKYMNKGITAEQNYNAFTLLSGSNIEYRVSFIVGYPGETPENFMMTHDFLLEHYTGKFMLNIFLFADENMPVWQDSDIYNLKVKNVDTWSHRGMDSNTAKDLLRQTITDIRWKTSHSVYILWQSEFEIPLVPDLSFRKNLYIEKLVERLAFLSSDASGTDDLINKYNKIMNELKLNNIVVSNQS